MLYNYLVLFLVLSSWMGGYIGWFFSPDQVEIVYFLEWNLQSIVKERNHL